jgi:hypothetical protein
VESTIATVTDFFPVMATGITALVAGGIALLIHRQRLQHEREEADLTLVRSLLTEGTGLMDRIVRAAKGPLLCSDDPDYLAYRQALVDVAEGTGVYRLRLWVLFAEEHEVWQAWSKFHESASALIDTAIAAATAQQEGRSVDRAIVEEDVGRVDAAAGSWLVAATRVGRARLRKPGD